MVYWEFAEVCCCYAEDFQKHLRICISSRPLGGPQVSSNKETSEELSRNLHLSIVAASVLDKTVAFAREVDRTGGRMPLIQLLIVSTMSRPRDLYISLPTLDILLIASS